ncbi:MAG: SurA N-terminal domain-containing protein [Neomegalonema sp.]|nr:SurA N-terminal domain-containing protein [Neomegalonema sp.]
MRRLALGKRGAWRRQAGLSACHGKSLSLNLGVVFGLVLSLFLGLSPIGDAARAQAADGNKSPFTILVKVDDAVISVYDVRQRMALLKLAGDPRTGDALQTVALESLVADHIKLKEGERQGIPANEQAVANALANIAQNNNMSPAAFEQQLKSAGVERETFDLQIGANLVWNELIRRRYGDRVVPTDEEIDDLLKGSGEGAAQARYQLEQIVVPIGARANSAAVKAAFEKAREIQNTIKSCNDLGPFLKRYPAKSGKVGTMTVAQMPPPLRKTVPQLQLGQAADPLRSSSGFHVVVLCGKDQGGSAVRQKIYDRLLSENVARFSESYLEDLRRTALIERRQ